MKKLLLISYYFPPDGGAGTQRSVKFCRYLPEFGWETIVLTKEVSASRGKWNPEDQSLLEEVGAHTQIIRVVDSEEMTWSKSLFRIDKVPFSWLEAVYNKAKVILQENAIDAILFSMSPFSLSYIGGKLKQETHVPIFYDLRDPWILDGWQKRFTWLHWFREFLLMKKTLIGADGIIINTPESYNAFKKALPQLEKEKVCVITNGYDESDFLNLAENKKQQAYFTLIHTGTLHNTVEKNNIKNFIKRLINYTSEKIKYKGRTTYYLFKAINILREKHPALFNKLKVILVGIKDVELEKAIEENKLQQVVKLVGYVSHTISIQYLLQADGLFLPLHGLYKNARSLIVPGKTYEYLASGKPILACLPEGDAKDFVQKANTGFFANPCNVAEIVDALITMMEAHDNYKQIQPNKSFIVQFERKLLTEKLAHFLNKVIKRDN